MSEKYKITEHEKGYFLTFTIVDWINVLEDDSYKMIVVDSMKYCQLHKSLMIYAYCIMSNHVHMIVQAGSKITLPEILRDIKKFTANKIIAFLQNENNAYSNDILSRLEAVGKNLRRIKRYKVWQDGNRPKVIFTNKFLWQKLDYIHNNPVKKGIVSSPEEYKFSSARNYAEMESVLDIELLTIEMKSVR
ncbi:MAG: transposase [Bacteroidota bacterium]